MVDKGLPVLHYPNSKIFEMYNFDSNIILMRHATSEMNEALR